MVVEWDQMPRSQLITVTVNQMAVVPSLHHNHSAQRTYSVTVEVRLGICVPIAWPGAR